MLGDLTPAGCHAATSHPPPTHLYFIASLLLETFSTNSPKDSGAFEMTAEISTLQINMLQIPKRHPLGTRTTEASLKYKDPLSGSKTASGNPSIQEAKVDL